jgi:hypothetical protein
MTDDPPNPHAAAAEHYLIWALEELEKGDNQEAAQHARKALSALGRAARRSTRKE